MTLASLVRIVAWWAVILAVAVFNGGVREKLLIPLLGPSTALVTSGLILAFLVLAIAWVAVPGFGRLRAADYWRMGVIWLVLTVAFEFGFGMLGRGQDLAELLQAYTFQGGNLWLLVLASTLVSPRLAARLRGLT